MRVCFTAKGWADYLHWAREGRGGLVRLNAVIRDARRQPFTGLGKPEALKGDLSGWWSRRITGEHRLVHRVVGKAGEDHRIEVAMCRYHYG